MNGRRLVGDDSVSDSGWLVGKVFELIYTILFLLSREFALSCNDLPHFATAPPPMALYIIIVHIRVSRVVVLFCPLAVGGWIVAWSM